MPVKEPACLGTRQVNTVVRVCKSVHFPFVVDFCSLETDTEANHSRFSCCFAAQTSQFDLSEINQIFSRTPDHIFDATVTRFALLLDPFLKVREALSHQIMSHVLLADEMTTLS